MDAAADVSATAAKATSPKSVLTVSRGGRKRRASYVEENDSAPVVPVTCLPKHKHSAFTKLPAASGRKVPRDQKIDDFPAPVLSLRFRDSSIALSPDRLTATGCKGWSTVLLTHGASVGCWYFEAILGGIHPFDNEKAAATTTSYLKPALPLHFTGWTPQVKIPLPHIRVGWGCRYSRYDMPLGCDAFGVCLRDVEGTVVSSNSRRSYANTFLGNGTVVGCCLVLGPSEHQLPDPRLKPELHPFLESGLLCDPLRPPKTELNIGASVEFLINGKTYDSVPLDLMCGVYHPGISLFMGAQCRINTGPEFIFPPPPLPSNVQQLTGYTSYLPACNLPKPPF